MTEEPDFYNLIARERGMPEGWRWYSLEARPTFFAGPGGIDVAREKAVCLVKGAVCTAVITRGPRKGHTNWKKLDRATECEMVITFVEYDARVAAWRAEQADAAVER
jgi:hypothetical protein